VFDERSLAVDMSLTEAHMPLCLHQML